MGREDRNRSGIEPAMPGRLSDVERSLEHDEADDAAGRSRPDAAVDSIFTNQPFDSIEWGFDRRLRTPVEVINNGAD